MAVQGFVLLTSSSEEQPYRSANHPLTLLLIIDVFIPAISRMAVVGAGGLS